jgi:predicted dehydrogenase
MAIDLTQEQKEIGKSNFHTVVGQYGPSRRDFMKGLLATGSVLPISAAAYYGYSHLHGNPVRAGLIGAGDEGGVLVGEHNPEYLKFIAFSDLRPSNKERIFKGEPNTPRKGFERIYGKDARSDIKFYENYKDLLANKDIEAVVIALPLHLHAPVTIEALQARKHVLCEKLMAWNVSQCKDMIQEADKANRVLAIGHQRHYSLLYAQAVEVLNSDVLGDVKHIRALWHRNNSWPMVDSAGNIVTDPKTQLPVIRDSWRPPIRDEDRLALESRIHELGYKSMEELVRWRLYQRTGGGLMAELGSHQLDACSIFLGKVHPLAVSGVGTRAFYRDEYRNREREVDDHVFVTFEFPGKNYYANEERKAIKDKDDVVVVTYSSINTNSFEPYGECVMGTRGTMVVEMEKSVMLFPEKNPAKAVPGSSRSLSVSVTSAGGGQPALDASATSGPVDKQAAETGQGSLGGDVSRGYREEMEHFAHCIRMHGGSEDPKEQKKWRETPRCHGRVAMADAIIALTANQAMRQHQRIEFNSKWFDAESTEVPDADMKPEEA